MTLDGQGNVIVTGSWSQRCVTAKYNKSGSLLWSVLYPGVDTLTDEGLDVTTDTLGNIYVVGYTSHSPFNNHDFMVLKYDPDGNLLWDRTYNGPSDRNDKAEIVTVASNGDVYVGGSSPSIGTTNDAYLRKYDNDGNFLWEYRRSGGEDNAVNLSTMCLDLEENLVIVTTDPGVGTGMTTAKFAPDGNVVWEQSFDLYGLGSGARSIAIDSVNNIILAGDVRVPGGGAGDDLLVLKYDEDGNQLWSRTYGGPGGTTPQGAGDVVVDSSDNIIACGSSRESGTDTDFLTIKFSSTGDQLWVRLFDSASVLNDVALVVALDDVDHIYVGGVSNDTYKTIKYDPAGEVAWQMTYDNPDSSAHEYADLCVDTDRSVYVTGWISLSGSGTGRDIATIKYIQSATIAPSGFSIIRGQLVSGGLPELFDSDDQKLVVNLGAVPIPTEPPVQVEFTGIAQTASPSELRFHIESSVSSPNLSQSIELFNYTTGLFEVVSVQPATLSDTIQEIVVTTAPERFVSPTTLGIKARVKYKAVGTVVSWIWQVRIDRAVWVISP